MEKTTVTTHDGVTVVSHGFPDPSLVRLAVAQLVFTNREEDEHAT